MLSLYRGRSLASAAMTSLRRPVRTVTPRGGARWTPYLWTGSDSIGSASWTVASLRQQLAGELPGQLTSADADDVAALGQQQHQPLHQ